MLEQGTGNAQIALGIFEIDRINFVRHDRTASLVRVDPELKVAITDVLPNIAAHAQQDRVQETHVPEQLAQGVMTLDLSAEGVVLQPQNVFNEVSAHVGPRRIGQHKPMRVEIPHGSVHFALETHIGDFGL